ncbi:MAG: hypothetical protein WC236_00215 [Gallionellaceae bacterium]|jgi:hypothetical protein
MNRRFLWLTLICALVISTTDDLYAADTKTQFVGSFLHVESSNGEHCEGYGVTLWRKDESLVGILNHHRSLCGDPPTGFIEDVQYVPDTGDLSFKVKLWAEGCMGFDFKAGMCTNTTKDIVTFRGKLKSDVLEGTITWYSINLKKKTLSEKVYLKREADGHEYKTYAGYERFVEYWLKVVEPQWNSSK